MRVRLLYLIVVKVFGWQVLLGRSLVGWVQLRHARSARPAKRHSLPDRCPSDQRTPLPGRSRPGNHAGAGRTQGCTPGSAAHVKP